MRSLLGSVTYMAECGQGWGLLGKLGLAGQTGCVHNYYLYTQWLGMVPSHQFVVNIAQYFRPKPPSLKTREEICYEAYRSVHLSELEWTEKSWS